MATSLSSLQSKLETPHLPIIDLSNIKLEIKHLKEISKYLCENRVTYQIVGLFKNLNNDDETERALLRNILSKLQENASRHPTDFIHALLSKHAYHAQPSSTDPIKFSKKYQVYNKHVEEWILCYAINDEKSGYYGAIYINTTRKQIVVAHRGSVKFSLKDLRTDINGITFGKMENRGHFTKCYEITLKALDYYPSYSISFTGHSLGGFLAELSMFFCAKEKKFNMRLIKAVNFESPGSERPLTNLQPNILSEHIDLRSLNIVSYLMKPNIINCCNKHIGTIYVINHTNDFKDFRKFLAKISFTYRSIVTLKEHSLIYTLKEFDPSTGLPREFQLARDWPHCPTDSIFDFITSYITKNHASELRTLQNSNPEKLEKSDMDIDAKLEYSTHFLVDDRSDFKARLDPNDKQSEDYLLFQLSNTRLDEYGDLQKKALEEIRSLYEIEKLHHDQYEIKMKSNIFTLRNLKTLIGKFKRQGALNFVLNSRSKISNYFEADPDILLIHRTKYIKKVYDGINSSCGFLIFGSPGSGKSTLARQVGETFMSVYPFPAVVWFDSDDINKISKMVDKILMQDLGTDHPSCLIREVNKKFKRILFNIESNNDINYLFIFDNISVQMMSIVENMIKSKPLNLKILITSICPEVRNRHASLDYNHESVIELGKLTNDQYKIYLNKELSSSFEIEKEKLNQVCLSFDSDILPYELKNLVISLKSSIRMNNSTFENRENELLEIKEFPFDSALRSISDHLHGKSLSLLKQLAFLDSSNISIYFLEKLNRYNDDFCMDVIGNVIDYLTYSCFVERPKDRPNIRINTSMQRNLINWMKKKNEYETALCEQIANILKLHEAYDLDRLNKISKDTFQKYKSYYPHLKRVVKLLLCEDNLKDDHLAFKIIVLWLKVERSLIYQDSSLKLKAIKKLVNLYNDDNFATDKNEITKVILLGIAYLEDTSLAESFQDDDISMFLLEELVQRPIRIECKNTKSLYRRLGADKVESYVTKLCAHSSYCHFMNDSNKARMLLKFAFELCAEEKPSNNLLVIHVTRKLAKFYESIDNRLEADVLYNNFSENFKKFFAENINYSLRLAKIEDKNSNILIFSVASVSLLAAVFAFIYLFFNSSIAL